MTVTSDPSLRCGATARRYALDGERMSRLHDDVVAAIVDAGFARHLVPVEWGGRGGSAAELVAGIAEIGAGCASAAWCAGGYAVASGLVANLPADGQRAVWAAGPDTLVTVSTDPAPGVVAEPVAGGTRLSGWWSFAAGIEHAEWVIVSVGSWLYAVKREQGTVHADWDNMGLRAIGAHTFSLDGTFVPAHLTMSTVDDRRPLMAAATMLGAARGAIGKPTDDLTTAEQLISRATGSHALVLAADLLCQLVDLQLVASGRLGQSSTSPVQRAWRDVHAAAGHL